MPAIGTFSIRGRLSKYCACRTNKSSKERRAELEAETQATVSNNVAFVLGKMQELQGKLQTFGEEVGVIVGAMIAI